MYAIGDTTFVVGDVADLARACSELSPAKGARAFLDDNKTQRDNKALIARLYHDVFNGGELDALNDFFAESYLDHSGFADRKGIRKLLSDLRRAYSEIAFTIQDIVSEGDQVVVRSLTTLTGRSEQRTISWIVVYRLLDGKIVESWGHSDSFF
jgi:predicted SnoaL-like aldol condensation-catalyzing enzyme